MNELVIFGIAAPQIVLVVVEILKKVGIVATGDQARLANILISSIVSLAGALIAEYQVEPSNFVLILISAVWSVVVSALEYNGGEALVNRLRG
jgi:hypothetical protein